MASHHTAVVDVYHWMDTDDTVHQIRKPIDALGVDIYRSHIHTRFGEARTVCGLRLGNDKYFFTLRPVSCVACIAGVLLGWRSIESNGPR